MSDENENENEQAGQPKAPPKSSDVVREKSLKRVKELETQVSELEESLQGKESELSNLQEQIAAFSKLTPVAPKPGEKAKTIGQIFNEFLDSIGL